jgi:hypothetical protein
VVATWDEVLLPVLIGVGDRWRSTGSGIEVEHLLSESAESALRPPVRRSAAPVNARPVLLGALEPEDHRLPLVAVAAALAERSVAVRQLGVRVPPQALADAAARTGAVAVFLWSQGATGSAPLPPAALLAPVRPRPVLVAGGSGWADGGPADPRTDVVRVADLQGAVAALLAAVD